METCGVVLTLKFVADFVGMAIQVKPILQYFFMVPFVF